MSGKIILFLAGLVCGTALGSVSVGLATADTSSERLALDLMARLEAVEARVQALSAAKPTPKHLLLQADDSIILSTGKARIVMKKSGSVDVSGTDITIKASRDVQLKGRKILGN